MRARRLLHLIAVLASFSGLSLACSSQMERDDLASSSAAITSGCTLAHVGAPCDPDGPGLKSECGGVCELTVDAAGNPTARCVDLTDTSKNDGKVCGAAANKRSNCNNTCKSGVCVFGLKAAVGVACKPNDDGGFYNSDLCDGQCDSSGNCGWLGSARCPRGTSTDCYYSFCSPLASKTCVNLAHASGVNCSDGNTCTASDKCDGAGKCVGTPTEKGSPCSDGNVCTTDACDGAGKCTSVPRDCDDKNPCTVDSCTTSGPSPGCRNVAKVCPGDACHTGSCDSSTGECVKTPISCVDFDPCTTDSCEPGFGCKFTPIPGCGDAGLPDTGTIDTGTIDTGTVDTGTVDTGTVDTGTVDTGTIDTGTIDTGTIDTGTIDTGTIDTGTVDTASNDTAPADSGVSDTNAAIDGASDVSADGSSFEEAVQLESGCGCRTAPRSSGSAVALSMLAAGVVVARRRRGAGRSA